MTCQQRLIKYKTSKSKKKKKQGWQTTAEVDTAGDSLLYWQNFQTNKYPCCLGFKAKINCFKKITIIYGRDYPY